MDKELKAKWVDALRSGNFTQGRYKLRDVVADTYCCLGVLAEVIDDPENYPPDRILELPKQTILAGMNDGVGGPVCNFQKIADYIEENL